MTLSAAGRRRKGSVWATAVANYLHAHVSPAVTLTAAGQARDAGDISGLPAIIECKNHREIELGEWSTQAERSAIATKAYRWALFVKRRGKARVEDGWMIVPCWFGCELLAAWARAEGGPLLGEEAG